MSQIKLSNACIKRLNKEYVYLVSNPIPNIKIYRHESNILKWFYCFYGLDGPYQGGEYFGLIEMSPEYPYKPPTYYIYTPNGRFDVSKSICTTASNYHNESWSPAWTMDSLFRGFLSMFLENNDSGPLSLNHLRTDNLTKIEYSRRSKEYNSKTYESLSQTFGTDGDVIMVRQPAKIKIKLKEKTDKQDQ